MSGHIPLPADPIDLPLLPLRDVVVFPHMVIPLFVGRPKSIKALEAAMESERRIMLVAQKAAAKDHAPAVANLAWVRCSSSDPQVRDPVAGTRLVSSALERRRSANLNDTLAACLAASELYVQAVAVQRETLTLAASEANLDDAQRRAFAERLAQYQRGQPWREPD